jgi:hypothetical protein
LEEEERYCSPQFSDHKRSITIDPLIATLERVRRKLARQLFLNRLCQAWWFAGAFCLLWVIAAKCSPVPGNPVLVVGAALAMGLGAASLITWLQYPDLERAAMEADERLGLKQRLISSIELADQPGPLVKELHADARAMVLKLDPTRSFRLTIPRHAPWIVIMGLIIGGVYGFAPEFDPFGFRARRAAETARKEALRVRVKRLDAVAGTLQGVFHEHPQRVGGLISEVEQISQDLQAGRITTKQAFARLSPVTRRLTEIRTDTASLLARPRVTSLLVPQPDGSPDSRGNQLQETLSQALKRIGELRDRPPGGANDTEGLAALERELSQLAKELGGSESLSGQALAEALDMVRKAQEQPDGGVAAQAVDKTATTLKEIKSLLDQLERMEAAREDLWQARQALLGERARCGFCGKALKACTEGDSAAQCAVESSGRSICPQCAQAQGRGLGMRGPGRGKGGQMPPPPDELVMFQPSRLTGPVRPAKPLVSIVQRMKPKQNVKASTDFVIKEIARTRREAEQALTKENIPPGAREFVRQYFGAIEPRRR